MSFALHITVVNQESPGKAGEVSKKLYWTRVDAGGGADRELETVFFGLILWHVISVSGTCVRKVKTQRSTAMK